MSLSVPTFLFIFIPFFRFFFHAFADVTVANRAHVVGHVTSILPQIHISELSFAYISRSPSSERRCRQICYISEPRLYYHG